MKKIFFLHLIFLISSKALLSQNFKLLGLQFSNTITEKNGLVFVSDSIISITLFNKNNNKIDTSEIVNLIVEKTSTQYKCKDSYFELFHSGVKSERKANIYYLKQYIGVNTLIYKMELLFD